MIGPIPIAAIVVATVLLVMVIVNILMRRKVDSSTLGTDGYVTELGLSYIVGMNHQDETSNPDGTCVKMGKFDTEDACRKAAKALGCEAYSWCGPPRFPTNDPWCNNGYGIKKITGRREQGTVTSGRLALKI